MNKYQVKYHLHVSLCCIHQHVPEQHDCLASFGNAPPRMDNIRELKQTNAAAVTFKFPFN